MRSEPIIRVRRLSHVYERWGHRVRALDDISFDVSSGEWLVLVGPNGSGKSTLLRLLAGSIEVQEGQVLLGGTPVGRKKGRALTGIFLVNQDPGASTASGLTVREHLLLADGRSWSGPSAVKRASDLLRSFNLNVKLNQPVDSLSGGQRQLLVLLMARIRPAPIVLLDEPLAALDPVRSSLCIDAITQLHQEGKTIVLVTHDMSLALSLGDRTLGLSGGRVAYDRENGDRNLSELQGIWRAAPETKSRGPEAMGSQMAGALKVL